MTFLLTHPLWDVTRILPELPRPRMISTHTSLVGCDCSPSFFVLIFKISTHTSLVGCEGDCCSRSLPAPISTHTSLVGCDAIYSILQSQHPHISRDGLIIHLELY